jgi:hypothetical protein
MGLRSQTSGDVVRVVRLDDLAVDGRVQRFPCMVMACNRRDTVFGTNWCLVEFQSLTVPVHLLHKLASKSTAPGSEHSQLSGVQMVFHALPCFVGRSAGTSCLRFVP